MDGYLLMQRFTLIHDGSEQGWQAAYLAFHIAVQLGAPLRVLMVDSTIDKKILAQRATEVGVGGRAAGVAVETRLVTEFSVDVLTENTNAMDGIFIPKRFIPDGKTAEVFLEAVSCPIWIVSKGAERREMAVLVDNLAANQDLVNETQVLANRIKQPLTGIVREREFNLPSNSDSSINWIPLTEFSAEEIAATLSQIGTGLLVIPVSLAFLIDTLPINCVVFPVSQEA